MRLAGAGTLVGGRCRRPASDARPNHNGWLRLALCAPQTVRHPVHEQSNDAGAAPYLFVQVAGCFGRGVHVSSSNRLGCSSIQQYRIELAKNAMREQILQFGYYQYICTCL